MERNASAWAVATVRHRANVQVARERVAQQLLEVEVGLVDEIIQSRHRSYPAASQPNS